MLKFNRLVLLASAPLLINFSTASANDGSSIVIAIPGTPQGIDLDRQSGPQTWTLSAQVLDLGAEWEMVPYPFKSDGDVDPSQIPGFGYPNYTQQKMAPGIIQSCNLSEDGKAATYNLRPGVRSAAGNEFTSQDVLYRVERAIANNAITQFIQNAVNAGKREQWQAVDSHTVRITAESPMPLICKVLTNPYFYWLDSKEAKKNATKEDPWSNNWVATKGIGFGPYTISKWEAGRRVEMTANPNYWRGEPKIKKIIWQVVPESANRLALLSQGRIDIAESLSPDEIKSLSKGDKARVAAVRGNQGLYAVFNNKTAPFDKAEVREAVNLMIPREKIVKEIYKGMAEPWSGVIPSLYPGYVSFPNEQSVDKAKALLTKVGYPNGFETPLAYSAGDPVQESIAILMQTSLREIGIKVQLQKMPVSAHSDLVQSKKAPFAFWIDFPIQPDPNYSLGLIYGTNNAVNYQSYSSPAVDDILKKGLLVVDPAERNKVHEEAQRVVQKDNPIGWIAEPHYTVALKKNISGWKWYPSQYYRISELTLN